MSLLIAVGCAGPIAQPGDKEPPLRTAKTRIDLHALVGDSNIRGLAVREGALDVLVDGRGILRVDRDGNVLEDHPLGQQGLEDRAYRDVSSLDNGVFVLLADNEGYLWDPINEELRVHFCVEPGFEPGEPVEPVEPVVIQRNDAVAVSGNLILAAPRFYELMPDGSEILRETSLRTYRAGDGVPLSSADLTSTGVELEGIAQAGDVVLGASGDRLYSFTLEGELVDEQRLENIERASGVAVDLVANELFVADEEGDEIRIYDL